MAGIWEGFFRSTLDDGTGAGDTRIERQAWRLTQTGGAIAGFYVVELTMISGDGRAYMCSREPRFSTLLRFEVRGRVDKDQIELQEIGEAKSKGPCRPTGRTPARFRADVRGDVLTLSDTERRVTLYRRPPDEAGATDKSLLAFATPDPSWDNQVPAAAQESVQASHSTGTPANVHGLWVWEHRGTMATGDQKVEREEWHLTQDGTKVSGYYDRIVRQISTDGQAYRCNSALDFRVLTRYQVTGEIQGDRIMLSERGFEILEGGPCDTGRRRLDAYQGHAAAGEIRLLWGVGTQVLRRARPNVPTQRF